MEQIIAIKPGSSSLVLEGDKVLTIQKGRNMYNLGCATLIDPSDDYRINVEILRVSYCKLKNTPQTDLTLHGEKTWENLMDYLKTYFPDIKKDSTITIVRYRMKKDKKEDKGEGL